MLGLRKHSALKPDSTLLANPLDGSRQLEQDFVHCCHCGRLWAIGEAIAINVRQAGHPDPATRLGFCARCSGVYCPGGKCSACVPVEQQLENVEKGLPVLTPKAPMVSTTGLVLPGE